MQTATPYVAPKPAPVPSSPQVIPTTVNASGEVVQSGVPVSSGSYAAGVPWGMIAGVAAIAAGLWYLLRKK